MKVAELITLLKNYPCDMEVLVRSYEEDFDPVTDCRNVSVIKAANKKGYNGYVAVENGGEIAVLIFSRFTRAESDEVDCGE